MKQKNGFAIVVAVLFLVAAVMLATIYFGVWGRNNGQNSTTGQNSDTVTTEAE